ncbi:hypothetical protein AM587_10000661 [Phytophthora nicotianae]|uniref:SWIM-type domain-containing protein n=1 Tax=Phytophthora nicotianae TaxID=4792 RepID=A0A0W8BYU0_PHYNI|nr:hypothetical protein AM587_10000661 [Phytophthora nicotianae]
MDIGTEPIRHFASGPVHSDLLTTALLLCKDDNHHPKHKGKSPRELSNIDRYFFNADPYVVRDDNALGVKVDGFRTRTYKGSLEGVLRRNETVENIPLKYLSLHAVKVMAQFPVRHDWDSPSWSVHEIERIRNKYKCDCKEFYQTGWLCAHILATLHLVDSLDLKMMLRNFPARKPPGRPRKKTRCLDRDGTRKSQYSVNALVKRLTEKPASVINWSILTVQTSSDEEGEETQRNYIGKIKPPFMRGGKWHWDIEYEELEAAPPVQIEELARTVNYSFQMGHNLVPN